VAADGTTFYAASDYQLQALDAVSHQPRWTTDLPGFVAAPPAVANGLVLTLVDAGNNGQLVAVDQATGQQRWTTGLGPSADFEQPPVVAGGLVYVTDSQNGIQPAAVTAYELDTGNQRWTQRLEMSDFGLDVSTPAVADGTVLVGDEDGNLYAFDAATGQLRYKHSDPEGALAFAGGFAITGGVLVTSDADATVRVLDIRDGAELWRQDISETNAYGPPAVAAGRIYVASFTRLHAYAIPGTNLPPSSGHLGAGMARHQSSRWGATFPTRQG
jgi:outer membrane protein assembly factor BamB